MYEPERRNKRKESALSAGAAAFLSPRLVLTCCFTSKLRWNITSELQRELKTLRQLHGLVTGPDRLITAGLSGSGDTRPSVWSRETNPDPEVRLDS